MLPCGTCKQLTTRCCVGCNLVYYCSVECQKKSWKLHKPVCKGVKIPPNKELVSSIYELSGLYLSNDFSCWNADSINMNDPKNKMKIQKIQLVKITSKIANIAREKYGISHNFSEKVCLLDRTKYQKELQHKRFGSIDDDIIHRYQDGGIFHISTPTQLRQIGDFIRSKNITNIIDVCCGNGFYLRLLSMFANVEDSHLVGLENKKRQDSYEFWKINYNKDSCNEKTYSEFINSDNLKNTMIILNWPDVPTKPSISGEILKILKKIGVPYVLNGTELPGCAMAEKTHEDIFNETIGWKKTIQFDDSIHRGGPIIGAYMNTSILENV